MAFLHSMHTNDAEWTSGRGKKEQAFGEHVQADVVDSFATSGCDDQIIVIGATF